MHRIADVAKDFEDKFLTTAAGNLRCQNSIKREIR
jgi:hypothetical protein